MRILCALRAFVLFKADMSKELTYLEAIREALFEEMRRDPKVFVLGEDVGPYGGAFGMTQGLYDEFGELRCMDTPISESAIIGVSIGASLRGYRPVAEMQFADFISCGFDQIVNQAATLRYRYGGRASCPIVVRGRPLCCRCRDCSTWMIAAVSKLLNIVSLLPALVFVHSVLSACYQKSLGISRVTIFFSGL